MRDETTRRQLLAGMAGLGAIGGMSAWAKDVVFDIENMLPGEFTWHPERSPAGPVAIVVSLPQQRVHVYRNGVRIAVSTCSTGKKGHRTPTGVFTILQKDKHHHSSTYNNAPMPNMNRLTWDGIALHAGHLPGYPASHGCVRLPLEFSDKLFTVTHMGTPVIVAGSQSDAWELVHPGVVLGNFAEDEMAEAVAALDAKHHPSDWSEGDAYPIVTVLATAADRRVVLIEDGVEITESRLGLSEDGPLGEHVLVLSGPANDKKHMRWIGLTHHEDPLHPGLPETNVLQRLGTSDEFLKELRARMHPGMTMIISDLAAGPERRSGQDFVIMTGDTLQTPRPNERPESAPSEG